ncbi:MAG: hypothetical protein ACPGJV_11395 [Bacteriovoracaceae bacterium]
MSTTGFLIGFLPLIAFGEMDKYAPLMIEENQMWKLKDPRIRETLKNLSFTMPVGFILHGAATLYAALRLNK